MLVVGALALGTSAHAADPRPPEQAAEATDAPRHRGLAPLLSLRGERDVPVTIESEEVELQALPDDGRRVRFLRDVRVRQGELALRAQELEAFYPPKESEPSRLVARGDVRIDQPGQRAFCDEAEYVRATDRLSCRGNARLEQGCDVVRGEAIEFELSADRARVVGGARVLLGPREGDVPCPAGPEQEGPAS